MGTPLELIKYNTDSGTFEIGKAALDTLRKVKGPVAVVAVCGRARQGKSFILNQLLLKSSGGGFQVGATHRPCTKGLWMWSSPQQVTAADGSKHHLVLLDTEGIDAYDQTAQYSTQIFSLAVLLSSMFVYNQMGGIDESALDRLSLVTEMTKHVRVRAAAGSAGGEEGLGEHSPVFLWLLRDFYLQLEEEGGRKITPRDYLETALRPVPGAGPAVSAKNGIRASIAGLFPNRDCFTLVRPMHDEAALSAMDSLPRDKLRPEFQAGVKQLTEMILSRAQPKRFGSMGAMTGPVLAGLVGAYVGAMNNGAVPTIATAWQGVAESECRRGCDAAEAAYAAAWAAGGAVAAEEAELEARHQSCLAAARAAFEDIAVGDEAIKRAHEQRWQASVAARYKDVRGRLLAEAAAAVNELLYRGASEVAAAARGGADLPALQQRLAAFVAGYDKAAAGPTKWVKLAAWLGETWPAAAGQVLDRQAAAARSAAEAAAREATELKSQLAAERQRAEQAERLAADAGASSASLQTQLAALQQEAARLRAAADQKAAKVAALEAQMSEVLLVSERKQASAGELAEARVRAAASEAAAKVAEVTAALTAERARAASLTADLEGLTVRCGAAESRLAAREAEADEWRGKYGREAAARVELQGQRDQARDALALLTMERDSAARERDAARAELAAARADLAAEAGAKGAMQSRLDELVAEAQAARAQAFGVSTGGGGGGGNDENAHPDANGGAAPAAAAGAAAAGRGPLADAGNVGAMTVQEIKDALTQAGFMDEVWALTNRKPAPKKADWVDLMRRRAAAQQ
ncbi:hypothetical protein CHLRE_11g467610v5 [Chlamydomonas reinhardtii]|uniref:GB1/RHD3-type G domain-containing protein n=1 Tax=Chlamydomonas reinhardtii TaxID=3055 RepID=A0A2K3D7F2_CHLRE|nr:uncharacterized protein CHLRE_11g467610v5 [Chlamydomonas reinhardtii]PNW76463.1 hypothetical protein CHLRE_11g467610v5 [Chlamydomonas reinhardtii]